MGGEIFLYFPYGTIPEGVQGASGKPPGRTRRCEIPCETGKSKEGLFLAIHKESVFYATPLQQGPEGFQRAIGKPFGRLRRGEDVYKRQYESRSQRIGSSDCLAKTQVSAKARADV